MDESGPLYFDFFYHQTEKEFIFLTESRIFLQFSGTVNSGEEGNKN